MKTLGILVGVIELCWALLWPILLVLAISVTFLQFLKVSQ